MIISHRLNTDLETYFSVFTVGSGAFLEAADATIGAVGRVFVLVTVSADEAP